MAFPWAQAIGVGVSALSRLFGDDDAKSSSRIDLKQLVADAEAAGFNPLTVLRNGGAAGYTQTHTPVLSSRAALGEALGVAGSFLANYDPMADEMKQAEYDLVSAQIDNLNAQTANYFPPAPGKPGAMFDPISGYGSVTTGGKAGVLTAGDRTLTNVYPVGSPQGPNPKYVDAEAWEARYSDFGGWIGGAVNALADGYWASRNYKPPRGVPYSKGATVGQVWGQVTDFFEPWTTPYDPRRQSSQ